MLSDIVDVSVIVITFNPVLKKLYKTLDSVVCQKGIRFEIIVCDDGSQIRFEKELRNYFLMKGLSAYRLIFHDSNKGTVKNYYSGLEQANGTYSKVISPGDFFTDENILFDWVQFLKNNETDWSFSDAYYYCEDNDKNVFIRKRAHPQVVRPYLKKNNIQCIWNYIANWDNALGAAMLGKTHIQESFCRKLMEEGVVYAEDYIYYLMMFDGIVGSYYPKAAICYEYGTGISTSQNKTWGEKLQDDTLTVRRILMDTENPSIQQKAIIKSFTRKKKIEKVFIRGKLYLWLKYHFFPRLTRIPGKSGQNEDK